MVPEVCKAVVEVNKDKVFAVPETPDEWRALAQEFEDTENVLHAVGVLAGTIIPSPSHQNTGSLYHNYKVFFFLWGGGGGGGLVAWPLRWHGLAFLLHSLVLSAYCRCWARLLYIPSQTASAV